MALGLASRSSLARLGPLVEPVAEPLQGFLFLGGVILRHTLLFESHSDIKTGQTLSGARRKRSRASLQKSHSVAKVKASKLDQLLVRLGPMFALEEKVEQVGHSSLRVIRTGLDGGRHLLGGELEWLMLDLVVGKVGAGC